MSDIKKCSCGSEDHTVEGLLSDSQFEIVRLDKEISSLKSQLAAKAAEVKRLRKALKYVAQWRPGNVEVISAQEVAQAALAEKGPVE